ncbi:hypothetical protein [Flavobacterium tistrianum]|uniref:hypothetical protein n=1 Tax=Flavobacterium tistrianum TaxID=1685414 RepID=UPI000DAC10B1|nr:hypothetical protein [Flavobacterium tistrianum]KAF2340402.1 hypothetical protein DMB71_14835 [Flavobacterium tistrianum]
MKTKLINPILIACIIFLGISASAGLYEHLFGIPEMLKSPSAMTAKSNNSLGQAMKFWIPLHFLILLTIVPSLIFNWKIPTRKKLVLSAFVCYMYITIISIFFARKLETFKNMADNIDFQKQTSLWIAVSWHRPILMVAIEALLLIALSRPAPYRQA